MRQIVQAPPNLGGACTDRTTTWAERESPMGRRKVTPEERERRRHEANAARKNAMLRADVPLFADQLPEHTADGEYWRWRRNKAEAAERTGYLWGLRLLDVLRLIAIRRHALRAAGAEAFAKLDAHCRSTYPAGHWY